MKVSDIVNVIEEFAPPALAESYDNCALLVGDMSHEVSQLLVCVDVTEAIVDEVIEMGAEMILSHHPLIFTGLKQINGKNYIERCVAKLIKHDIALYSAHTSIDAAFGGVSFRMGEMLGLKNMEVLSVERPNGEGFGVVGELEKDEDSRIFLRRVKDVFVCGVIKHTTLCKSNVKKVALCGGSGSSLISKAKKCGADIYLAADFKYNNFFEAENEIILADIGHFESEQQVMDLFCDIILKKYCNFALRKTKFSSNPIIYL